MPKDLLDRETVSYKGTIQVRLDDQDVEAIQAWNLTREQQIEMLEDLAEQGYQVSVHNDRKNGRWSCSALGKYPHCPNGGYQVYGNGENCQDAIKCLLYKVTHLLQNVEWKSVQPTRKLGGMS